MMNRNFFLLVVIASLVFSVQLVSAYNVLDYLKNLFFPFSQPVIIGGSQLPCTPDYYYCEFNSDCCSGQCDLNDYYCIPGTSTTIPGSTTTTRSNCYPDYGRCSSNSQCCSGQCDWLKGCVPSEGTTTTLPGQTTTTQPGCIPDYSRCSSNSQCCSGQCDWSKGCVPSEGTTTTLPGQTTTTLPGQTTTTQPGCTPDYYYCEFNSDCCSGYCWLKGCVPSGSTTTIQPGQTTTTQPGQTTTTSRSTTTQPGSTTTIPGSTTTTTPPSGCSQECINKGYGGGTCKTGSVCNTGETNIGQDGCSSYSILSDNCCCETMHGRGCLSRSTCQAGGYCISDCPCPTTTTTTVCKPAGAMCASSSECCSNYCYLGKCTTPSSTTSTTQPGTTTTTSQYCDYQSGYVCKPNPCNTYPQPCGSTNVYKCQDTSKYCCFGSCSGTTTTQPTTCSEVCRSTYGSNAFPVCEPNSCPPGELSPNPPGNYHCHDPGEVCCCIPQSTTTTTPGASCCCFSGGSSTTTTTQPPENSFDVVFVPINYDQSEESSFKNSANAELSYFRQISPNSCPYLSAVGFIPAGKCDSCDSHVNGGWSVCQCLNVIVDCAYKNHYVGKRLVGIVKSDIWGVGCNDWGPNVALTADPAVTPNYHGTLAHELGHSFSLCHVIACDLSGGCENGCPNQADCNFPLDQRKLDIMTYCGDPNSRFGPAAYNYITPQCSSTGGLQTTSLQQLKVAYVTLYKNGTIFLNSIYSAYGYPDSDNAGNYLASILSDNNVLYSTKLNAQFSLHNDVMGEDGIMYSIPITLDYVNILINLPYFSNAKVIKISDSQNVRTSFADVSYTDRGLTLVGNNCQVGSDCQLNLLGCNSGLWTSEIKMFPFTFPGIVPNKPLTRFISSPASFDVNALCLSPLSFNSYSLEVS